MSNVSSSPFTVHYCNVNSLSNKLSMIDSILPRFPSTALLALSEVKLDRARYQTTPLRRFTGYDNHQFFHTAKSSGLLALSHASVPCRHMREFNDNGNMAVLLQVSIASLSFMLALVYVKPNCPVSVFTQLLKKLRCGLDHGMPFLILGDFNARHPALGDPIDRASSKAVMLLDWCDSHY